MPDQIIKATEVVTETPAVIVKEAEASPTNVTDLPTDQGGPVKFDSLFDNEIVTEAELKGEAEPSTEEKPAGSESKDGEVKPDGESAEAKPDDGTVKVPELTGDEETAAKADDGEPIDDGEEKPDYSKPPPKGYVPLPAVQKEREVNQDLRSKIFELQTQIEADTEAEPGKLEEKQEPFKVLSDAEFEELLEEDPDAALLYERKARQYEKDEQAKKTAKSEKQRQALAEAQAVTGFVDEIQTAVPGIYDQDTAGNPSDVMDNLVKHAEENGFDPTYLNAMTNPAAKIMLPGSKKVFNLGKGAVSLVKLIHKSLETKKASDPEALRAELTKEITAKVTQDLIKKFKNDASGIRNIGDIPGDSGGIESTQQYSEKDFHEMSPEDEKRALGG